MSFVLVLAFGVQCFAATVALKTKPPEIRFLSLSAPAKEPIEALLDATDVHVKTGARNVKLSIVFDHPLALSEVQLDSCATADWADGIEVFSAPGAGRVFTEGGRKVLRAKLKTSGPVESIAIVFGRNTDLCLRDLKFVGEAGGVIRLARASAAPVKISSSVGAKLFDSHPETQTALEDPLKVSFDETKTFDRAIVWTGGTALFSHALKLKGEKGWSETLPLRNTVAEQEVVFKKPFTGKEITLVAADAGEISEVRFANRTKVQSLVSDLSVADDLTKRFAEAGFETVLDSKWTTDDEDKWKILFRSDGTFFIRGFNDDTKQARAFSSIGAYTVVRQEKGKLRLRINGVRLPTGTDWDGVSCPFACGSEVSLENSTSVVDSLVLEQSGEGSIMIRNRTPRSQRTMSLGDLKIHRAVED